MHGRLDAVERDSVMSRFRSGETQCLVATVVIEVGVDVPNATMMVIEHAERFGLAQLHQLRGRVGRGLKESVCALVGAPTTDEGQRRLEAIASTDDGFKIAELDLEIRGPGELFGARQSGMPPAAGRRSSERWRSAQSGPPRCGGLDRPVSRSRRRE